jgi:7-alpha-hydroxysteroid dehydrogenase
MSFSISGKTAIVTGAANGIGLAIARHFLDKGANVMFADMDEARLEDEVGEEARAEGPVRMFAGDLRQRLTIANLLSATVDAFDRIDIVVNASRQCGLSDALDPEKDGVEELLEQNLLTSLRLSQMAAKRMIQKAEKTGAEGMIGSIVNLSSLAAVRTQPQLLGYSISSAAVEQMTRSLAVALAPKGIRVNAVSFASVMSASLQGALRENPDWREVVEAGTPLGRIASADEVAEAAHFLASDASGFMTGQVGPAGRGGGTDVLSRGAGVRPGAASFRVLRLALGDHRFRRAGELVAAFEQAVKLGPFGAQVDGLWAGAGLGFILEAVARRRRGLVRIGLGGDFAKLPDGDVDRILFDGVAAGDVGLRFVHQLLDRAQVAGVAVDALFLRGAAGGQDQKRGEEKAAHGKLRVRALIARAAADAKWHVGERGVMVLGIKVSTWRDR